MIKAIIRNILKPFSFLPAILMMYLIFSFSAQDGAVSAELSYKVSYKIVEIGGELLGADFEPWEIENLANRFHGPVRKIAHMTEYFVLAITVAFPLYVYGLRGILLMLVAGVFCVGFACADEYHQAFVDGRGPSRKDVLIDSIGVFLGIIAVRIFGWIGRKTIFRPLSKKKQGQLMQDPQMQAAACQQGAQPNGASVYPPADAAPYPAQYYRNPGQPPQYNGYYGQPGTYYAPTSGNGAHGRPYDGYPEHPDGYSNSKYDYPQRMELEEEESTSDQLSEDMSFKRLMQELKAQKKEKRRYEKKPRLDRTDMELGDLTDDK